jgi:hypothetical protein
MPWPGRRKRLAQFFRERIAHVDRLAVLVDAAGITDPARDGERQAGDRSSRGQIVANGSEDSLRQLLRTVHGDLPGSMPDRGIVVALEQR